MKKFIVSIFVMLLMPIYAFAEQINVVFTIDNNYSIPAMLAINSILKNNESNSDYMFYIVEDNLKAKDKERISNFIDKHNQKVEFIHYSNPILQSDSTKHFNSTVTMARVIMPKLLPGNVDKVIYLDADILVLADLKKLYNQNLDNNYVGMVYNNGCTKDNIRNACGFIFTDGYFNSGVILMDLQMMRKDKIPEKMINFVIENPGKFIKSSEADSCQYDYPDQDLINIVLYKKIKILNDKWNQQWAGAEDAYIYHYIGANKPWQFKHKQSLRGLDLYKEYWKGSSLKIYKYYYQSLKVVNKYLEMYKKILSRYKFTQPFAHQLNID